MGNRIVVGINKVRQFGRQVSKERIGAYAAQSAFFIVLSLIPFILLLLTLAQFTPVTKVDVMTAVVRVIPKSINPFIVSVVEQVYNQSRSVIPLTAITAIWSAARGVLAMAAGLNSVYGSEETRGYVVLRIRAAFYTLFFIVAIVISLVLLVFGNSIRGFLVDHFPIVRQAANFIIQIRMVVSLFVLIAFSTIIYRFLPNHKASIKQQLPGALFTSLGWALLSYIFSVYVDVFKGFSNMYGSLTTIVLVMLWLYFCMYIMLLGGRLNVMLETHKLSKST